MSQREQEFEDLYRAYRPRLHALFTRRGVAREDARELAHQSFVNAWRAWDTFEARASRRTWLMRIALNVWKNYVRDLMTAKRGHGQAAIVADEAALLKKEATSEEATPEDKLIEAEKEEEKRRRLREAMERLPPQMRHCLELSLLGYRYREIADFLWISIGAVKSQIHEAKQKLKEQVRTTKPSS